MLIKVLIIIGLFSWTSNPISNAKQIRLCLNATSAAISKWSFEHKNDEDKLGTMRLLKCLHHCLIQRREKASMTEEMFNCFYAQTLMMDLWKEFLSRDDPMPCFERIKGKSLMGTTNRLFNNIDTIEECEEKCQLYREFECRSAVFYAKEKECILMPQTKDVSKYPFVDDADSIYTENWCLNRVGQKEFERSPNESSLQLEATTESNQIPAEVIDTYGMSPKRRDVEMRFQFKDEILDKNECFNEFYPANIKTTHIEPVLSIEECVTKCRECKRCLNRRKCSFVGYSVERQLCALGRKQVVKELDRANSMGNFVFLRRSPCIHKN